MYVYGFRGVFIPVGIDSVSVRDRAKLVVYAAKRLQSLHGGHRASVTVAGNGYQVRLPDCQAAGFSQEETVPVLPADGVLVVHREDRRQEDAREIQTARIRQTGQETLGYSIYDLSWSDSLCLGLREIVVQFHKGSCVTSSGSTIRGL